ncbi:hypothetical protein [Hyphomicrobium sp.]|uniref:hypothetical protein n=1 Tax=Hyphomicrobium sp. TaxID=82 RepID=UPI002E35A8FB|nr:hypothetical protein [Hyphomicrobium sp.]HEX2841283.1 hypothetical protein [Hyphomicrobium sp.]
MRALFAALFLLVSPVAVAEEPHAKSDETAIREVIATWYGELQQRGTAPTTLGRHGYRNLYAPGAIDGGPHDTETNPKSARLSPTISHELAAQALKFSYEIDVLKIDARFAKAIVWERGYFYAWAAQQTYETAASALFIFERQPEGHWLILAHEANSQGIPPTKRTDPMPDLRELFYATQGKERDPETDTLNKQKF